MRDPVKAKNAASGLPLTMQQEALVDLGFGWNCWIPIEVARSWKGDFYPISDSPQAIATWRQEMRDLISHYQIKARRAFDSEMRDSLERQADHMAQVLKADEQALTRVGVVLQHSSLPSSSSPSAPSNKSVGKPQPPSPAPFDLALNENRQVVFRGDRSADFRGFCTGWGVLRALVQRHPDYYRTSDLGHEVWNPLGKDSDPAELTVYRTLTEVRKLLRPIGLTVANRKKIGYRLEEAATAARSVKPKKPQQPRKPKR
jgi:DNA-binding winged helix-turn-helix (wHTH) protein